MKKINLLFIVLVLSSIQAMGQKIKYKDLFFLLETGKYDDAEPILKNFLKDDKNVDHANANLQMAIIFNYRADKTDELLAPDALVSNLDSALIYYELALKYIDEKEVKKNDEFYQAYQRRDIRTGKFGIKLADIQFDLEKKVTGLREKKERVLELKVYYNKTLDNYTAALEAYKKIKNDFPTQKILFLRSNDDLLNRITEVENKARLALQNFDSFQSTLKKIEKSGYSPAMHMKEIISYEKDGETNIDLTADNIDFWDYAKWAGSVRKGITDVITPLRAELVAYDQSLNQLTDRLKTDSMSVVDKISPISVILTKIREYDSDPLPEELFLYKIANLRKLSFEMDHLSTRDSADIIYQLDIVSGKLKYLTKMDSLANLLSTRDMAEDSKNYENFIAHQYTDIAGLQTFIGAEQGTVKDEKARVDNKFSALTERAKWLIEGQDSIPIFENVAIGKSKYAPLIINSELTAGLYFSGETPAQGYFATISNKRNHELKVVFKVDTENFKKQTLETTKTQITADQDGHVYYLMFYTQLPEVEEYAATICKIYKSDGLAWEKNIKLATAPKEMLINNNTGDLIIDYDMANYLGGQQISDRMVLDKKGQIKK